MQWPKMVAVGVLGVAVGFGWGFLMPRNVKETSRVRENRDVVTVTTRVRQPDGTVTTERRTEDRTVVDSATSKSVSSQRLDWIVSCGVLDVRENSLYCSVDRRIFGEVYIRGMASSEADLGLGLTVRF